MKKTSRPQSTSSYTSRGSRVRVISIMAAPKAAMSAGGAPIMNPTSTPTMTIPGLISRERSTRTAGGGTSDSCTWFRASPCRRERINQSKNKPAAATGPRWKKKSR